MSIDSRLRRAAEDARQKVTGLNPPPIRRYRRRAVLGWVLVGLSLVLLTLFLAPRVGTNPVADNEDTAHLIITHKPDETPTDTSIPVNTIPEVSKADYDAAFEEFRSCMSDRGGELYDVSETEFGTYEYSYSDNDMAIHDDCYFAYFRDAQIGYESHNEALVEANADQGRADWEDNVAPCLRANGYDVPSNFETARNEMKAEELQVLDMIYRGNLLLWGACENANSAGSVIEDLRVVDLVDSLMVLTYPADWHLADENLTPNLSNPREVFSVGSFTLAPGGPNCAQAPTQALQDMGKTDVFLTVQERTDASTLSGFDPWPDNFGPTPGSSENVFYDCLDPDERQDLSAIHWISFTENVRYFHALVAIGQDADPEDIAAVWKTLDRLVILPTQEALDRLDPSS